jgi:hypothetical protein
MCQVHTQAGKFAPPWNRKNTMNNIRKNFLGLSLIITRTGTNAANESMKKGKGGNDNASIAPAKMASRK